MHHEQSNSHEFSFDSKYMEVKGSKIHYLDEGQGEPMVFVHGVPASCYVWRNIMPPLQSKARCIAPDLIGFGLSDKPDISYSIQDHISYFNCFIQTLGLKDITLVLHGWGSVIGFNYLLENSENVKAIVFYEPHLQPETDWNHLSLPIQQLSYLKDLSPNLEKMILIDNYFLKKIFPLSMLHIPSKKVMEQYLAPFQTPASRKPLLQYINELPLGKIETQTSKLIAHYSEFLQTSNQPKLLLYSVPGFFTPIETVLWCKAHLKNFKCEDLGEELHFAQETMPARFAQILDTWYSSLRA